MSIALYILSFIVAYWIFSVFIIKESDTNSVLTSYLEEAKRVEKRTLNDRMLAPFSAVSRLYMNDEKKIALQELFDKAGVITTVDEYLKMKIFYPVIFTSVSIICSIFYEHYLFKLGIFIAPFLYFYPNYLLKKHLKYADSQRLFELPDYIILLIQLLKVKTTVEGVIQSQEFAGRYLKPYISRLASELEAYPGSQQPFKNFSAALDIPEVHTLTVALEQAQRTDKVQAMKILDSQIEIMRQLREENYNELIEKKPLEMNKYNILVLGCIMLFPSILVIQSLIEGFSQV